jgi:hypothetical protein
VTPTLAAFTALLAIQEVWAGGAILIGHRAVPILGKVEARTESFVLAKVTRTPQKIVLEQKSCLVQLMNPIGVKLALNKDAAEKLPPVELIFEKKGDGYWHQAPATTAWQKEDVDHDGRPGLTVNVDAPVCGGKLFVSLDTTSIARGTLASDGTLKGELKAKVRQVVLDTEGACLSVLIKDSDEKSRGTFAYGPVPDDSTCDSLIKAGWPVRAPEPHP